MTRTVPWPADLLWALVHHGSAHLGGVTHAVADRLCHEAADRCARSRRTQDAIGEVLDSGRYKTHLRNELIEWFNEEIEYRRGVLDGVMPLAKALTAAVQRDEELWQRFDDFRFGEAVQRAISDQMFDREFGA
jgi:hypothetical protein